MVIPSRALPDPTQEPTIMVGRAAAVLNISPRHAYAAVERGEIPSIRVGKSVRVLTARFLAAYGLAEPQQSDALPGSVA